MDTRTRILEAAARLLAESPDGDVSTRAVCEAAGVGAPMLYRIFGDKERLLSAVVDYGFEQYLARKRAGTPSADPVQDLRDGWDNHVAFALERPHYYWLMYSPAVRTPPSAAAEAHRLLTEILERCAVAGRLRVSPQLAAQEVMAANVGMALSLVTRPDTFVDPGLSDRVRNAVFADILAPADQQASIGDLPTGRDDRIALATAVTRLEALLSRTPDTALTAAETALLREWLTRLADAPPGSP